MKRTLTAIAIAFTVFCTCNGAQAQQINIGTYHFDYALDLADSDTTDWYVIWTHPDGRVYQSVGYETEKAANDSVFRRLLHGTAPGFDRGTDDYSEYPDVEVVELTMAPDWSLFETFDSYAEAQQAASYFESLGLLTNIRSVLDTNTLSQQSTYLPKSTMTHRKAIRR